MKLQAVMETLQRQQRARLQQELEARQLQQDSSEGRTPPSAGYPGNGSDEAEPEALKIQRAQAAALAAMRAAAAGLSQQPSPAASEEEDGESMASDEEDEKERDGESERYQDMASEEEDLKGKWDEDDFEDEGEDEYEDMEEGIGVNEAGRVGKGSTLPPKHSSQQAFPSQRSQGAERAGLPLSGHPQLQDHGDWTYEEQFKQLYELDGDPKRKEFLDDLFSFMQKRGTPVNRIPIMAKQVLDLYMLYVLVTEKGGLVEVINKKLWREITKGLNLPTSITSAAFTLRTQYMKYLYPYECEKRGLSNPNELQAAIDSNRREGRRQSFGGTLFTYSPSGAPSMLSSPKLQVSGLSLGGAALNGSTLSSMQKIKKEEDSPISLAMPPRIPVTLAGHSMVAAQVAAQAAALEQLREKLESGEPPEKKMALGSEEQQRIIQRTIQHNLLAMTAQLPMNIRINSQAEGRQDSAVNLTTNGTNSISMSVELNGIVYTGVLFAQPPTSASGTSKGSSNRTGSIGGGSSNSQAAPPSTPSAPNSNNPSP
ncbi:AT-rich interactive domain-containing protein 3A isoform X1 [Xenopus laevis]|uniref:AT-rich interactive domain-containing protein 3A n=3 Tax=Xenopus laevis TaxID=8355 RepID=ARI3A_XENLA|nr:AT-rich interactive domain-containing protein 3A [Xenopus laevis]XP_018092210.1 AT-rich interactive domain-containing protein 3A isoform X1 [Xenopus laevis]XP_018092218.1 AT-rich interactive domain-containing protein 3A isoform X1 [Xenopus laevis]XP_018092229.1 AT-rich interactive domain-containing protein 3A isoform X1 [Xenopus laevis]XP_018092236.1 AT-rich interactive domain-containing protein 3A isoform X1 [Xenopus laevis]XP_018092242.1 AT-rich interactive domain-containing protein 3A is